MSRTVVMDERRQNAYRYLLYWAMLDIRDLRWVTHRTFGLLNPFRLRTAVRDARRAGAIADWLHNLAMISATDFERFNEEAFWNRYDFVVRRYGASFNYRAVFDQYLAEGGKP